MRCDVIGFILAGGRGRRMGVAHKGLLPHPSGGTILSHLLAEMQAAGVKQVIVVTNEAEPYAGFEKPTIPDIREGMGPLGGVEAGLHHLRDSGIAQAAIFLPCDVPAIGRLEIARLLDDFRRDPQGVTVAGVAGDSRLQALCCVVGVDVLPAVRGALDGGHPKVSALWRRLGARVVVFPDDGPFRNVNTPEEHANSIAEGRR